MSTFISSFSQCLIIVLLDIIPTDVEPSSEIKLRCYAATYASNTLYETNNWRYDYNKTLLNFRDIFVK